MTVMMPPREATHVSPREMAKQMDGFPEYYVEIIGGTILVSPTPSKKHNGIVLEIQRQLLRQLREDQAPHPISSVEGDDGSDDYCSPDLIVVPAEQDYEEGWLYPANIVDFALEVVSRGNPFTDLHLKPSAYAGWGIPIFFLADPRDGTIVLHSDPVDGVYQARHRMKFGDTVTLPEPLKDVRFETAAFPLYSA